MKTLTFANVSLTLISYGSALCIGIEAQTPFAESSAHADKQAAAELAKEAIEQTGNRFANIGMFGSDAGGPSSFELTETHERFSYFAADEETILKGLEDLFIVQDQMQRRAPGWKPAKRAEHKENALAFYQSIPRESSFLHRLTLRNQEGQLDPARVLGGSTCGELWDNSQSA